MDATQPLSPETIAAIRQAEFERCRLILTCDEARAVQDLAVQLATQTNLPAGEAIEILANAVPSAGYAR